MIEQASIERLKQSLDIVDVIGNYIELKKAGANYKANCPFHGEKTPSFVVSPSKQIYHCFGCGAGGDAIKFVMEYEKLNYPETIEKLANMYNIPLRYTQKGEGGDDSRRVLETMQSWFKRNFEQTEFAKRYVSRRGITLQSAERFGIGYVPTSAEVMRFIDGASIPRPKALEAGILGQAEGGRLYPRLSERITFPIYSPSGALVGFGGRTTGNHPAKYINSPQTKLFNKSRLLYGYHLAKADIYKHKRLIVCEGYLDVIMLHQAGFHEAVATLGTALTQEHLPLLRKGEPKILLAYDGDKAGISAALKAARLLALNDFDGGVALFPEGNDPADMIQQGRQNEVAQLLHHATPLINFVIERTAEAYDISNPRQKETAFGEIKNFLDALPPILKEAYVPHAAAILRVSPALFGAAKKDSAQALKTLYVPKEDIALLSVLKSVAEGKVSAELVSDIADATLFSPYETLYEKVMHTTEDAQVRALKLDDTIRILSEAELKETIRTMLLRHYNRRLKTITADTTIPYEQKSRKIRKIKLDIIPRLKKGELVVFDASL
jgi:DNA primase